MRFDYAARARAGLTLIILIALYSNLQMLRASVEFDLSFTGNDDITQYERRFDGIKKMLPTYGTVGYLGGLTYPRYWLSDPTALRDLYLTQYTLAPVVVSLTAGHKLNLINSSADRTSPDAARDGSFATRDLGNGNTLIDFGNGLMLARSELSSE